MNKTDIRNKMLLIRKKIVNKKELSTIIVDKVFNLDIYQKANVVALYKSIQDEVDTTYLISHSLVNKKILLPKIINKKMVFIEINRDTLYQKSKIGVMEPQSSQIYNGIIDLIIVPGVSFDKEKNRLGFGKGYYDKFLSKNNIYKIGLCFNEQIIDELPISSFDIPMDIIITEKMIIK